MAPEKAGMQAAMASKSLVCDFIFNSPLIFHKLLADHVIRLNE